MNTDTASFDSLLSEMSLALDLAEELEGQLKNAAVAGPQIRSENRQRFAPAKSAFSGFGRVQPAF